MPDLNGFEVATLLRDRPSTHSVPIIFLTASKSNDFEFQGYESGAVDFILKPADPTVLQSKVEVFLNLYEQRQYLAREVRVEGRDLNEIREQIIQDTEFIAVRASRMMSLVDGLLKYAPAGASVTNRKNIDLNRVVTYVREMLESPISEAKATIHVDELSIIPGDKTAVLQLMLNLVANAVKFWSEDAPEVIIKSVTRDDLVEITVSDNGIGIDATHHQQILNPLSRLHSASKFEGSDLGLATCKKLVERHGGEIWLESALGQDTTVHVKLPVGEGTSKQPD